jgi:hypothetical protein
MSSFDELLRRNGAFARTGDVALVRRAPQVSARIKVTGLAYDVTTGRVKTVVPPR